MVGDHTVGDQAAAEAQRRSQVATGKKGWIEPAMGHLCEGDFTTITDQQRPPGIILVLGMPRDAGTLGLRSSYV